MHFSIVLRILGVLLMLYSLSMLPPAMFAVFDGDGSETPFFASFAITLISGILCWLPVYNSKTSLRTRDGFVVVVLFWTVLGLFGAFPFMLASTPHMPFTDAVFESVSGLTTTGATVLTQLDTLPRSILFYRQQLQWLGGMGIIVLAVAILPMLGVGGMQLYRAETPGPVKDNKLTPRIAETAKALWMIYLTLTLACALCYWLAGMTLFDAVTHSFSTVAIGGFSTHDESIAYFDSWIIEAITIFFMITAAVNFGLHYIAWRNKNIFPYFRDPEVQFFLRVLLMIAGLTLAGLYLTGTYDHPLDVLRYGIFETVSIATTTGYGIADFSAWSDMMAIALMLGSFMGGCAGSTGGGLKVIRVFLVFKHGVREIKRLIHPHAVFAIKAGRKAIDDRVVEAVWGFVSIYITCFLVIFLSLLATGLDFRTAFSAVTATINNLGPGLGDVSANYGDVTTTAKWLLCISMLLGRLEVFTLLVLFTPMFWRK